MTIFFVKRIVQKTLRQVNIFCVLDITDHHDGKLVVAAAAGVILSER